MKRCTYNPKSLERTWQKHWEEIGLFKAGNDDPAQKFYCLMMFPYPSGVLHMGHALNYTLGDTMVRYRLIKGMNVLSPMGWDSFGLPAENAAIKQQRRPADVTQENIAHMRRQIKRAGWGYDWDLEVTTSSPEYYRWTQWVFLKMYERGLAYRKEMPINWCPSCKTGLANEEVVGGVCERCGHETTKKSLVQWMLKITEYAERLLQDLDKLDWSDKVKRMQSSQPGRIRFMGQPIWCWHPNTRWWRS